MHSAQRMYLGSLVLPRLQECYLSHDAVPQVFKQEDGNKNDSDSDSDSDNESEGDPDNQASDS